MPERNLSVVIILILGLKLTYAKEKGPCEFTGCGVEGECFHFLDHEQNQEAVCLDEDSRVNPIHNGLRVYKHCPEKHKVGKYPLLGCGPNPQNRCELDTDCSHTSQKCCFDGCRNSCRKFILRPFP